MIFSFFGYGELGCFIYPFVSISFTSNKTKYFYFENFSIHSEVNIEKQKKMDQYVLLLISFVNFIVTLYLLISIPTRKK